MVKVSIRHNQSYEQFEVDEPFSKFVDRLNSGRFITIVVSGEQRAYNADQVSAVYDLVPAKGAMVKHEILDEQELVFDTGV